MSDFHTDNAWQRQKRDDYLVPYLYKRHAYRYQFIDSTDLQRKGVDTIVQWREDTAPVFIDEKIVRWPKKRDEPYDSFALETESCTVEGRESDGWMRYSEMDALLYCFETRTLGLDCYLINFPALCEWFFKFEKTFNVFQMENTINRSCGRVVPIISVLAANINYRRFQLEKEPMETPHA